MAVCCVRVHAGILDPSVTPRRPGGGELACPAAFRGAAVGYHCVVPKEQEKRRAPVPPPGVSLPPGYRVWVDPDLLVLRRADGSVVAAFSALGADPAEVEKEASEDYRRSGEGTA